MRYQKYIFIALMMMSVMACRLFSQTTLGVTVPVHFNDQVVGRVSRSAVEPLATVSFVEAEKGKRQEGWLLRDVLLLYVDADQLQPETTIIVTSSIRGKSATLTWAEVNDPDNMVMLDVARERGTAKLCSVMEKLDQRDEWVQDADKIEVFTVDYADLNP
jgi:hypothetical protein